MSYSKLISVIIPVYNSGKYLNKCLDSIINQTHKELDIILIDDGSTDGSGEVCDEYAQKDDRITVIHQQNRGVSSARNAGIKIAKGDFFNFPDSDDYIDTDCYEYCLGLMDEHKCDIVSYEYYVTYSDREVQHVSDDSFYGLFDKEGTHNVIMGCASFACNRVFSKKAVEGILFKEDIFRGEDGLFVHNCIEQIESAFFDKRAMYHYVQSEESAVRGKFRPTQLSVLKLYDEYKTLFETDYPKLWIKEIRDLLHVYIMLFYDMYSDENDYQSEMKNVYNVFKKQYSEIKNQNILNKKEHIKFSLFKLSPTLFCKIHKKAHNL